VVDAARDEPKGVINLLRCKGLTSSRCTLFSGITYDSRYARESHSRVSLIPFTIL